jgi:sodium transport system ATP-binding protein
MIEARHLAKSFSARVQRRRTQVAAVVNVSFDAPDGTITALLGPNGAGKTTTLRMVGTLVEADAGSITVGGIDVRRNARGVRAQLGMLSDARGLYARLTARENIAYYGDLRGIGRTSLQERLAMLSELLDMAPLLDRRTEGFSTGERMKVALARALIHDPQHLILDEPTSGLDVMSTRALRRLLVHLRSQGKCIVLSSHIMPEVEQLADRIVIVAHGRSIAQGSGDEIRRQAGAATLEDAFVALAYGDEAAHAGAHAGANPR